MSANETNSSIIVYWSPFIKYDFSNISYKLQCCFASSFNTSNTCTKVDLGSSTSYVFEDLVPDTIYIITLTVVSSDQALSINSSIAVKTKTGILYNYLLTPEVVEKSIVYKNIFRKHIFLIKEEGSVFTNHLFSPIMLI